MGEIDERIEIVCAGIGNGTGEKTLDHLAWLRNECAQGPTVQTVLYKWQNGRLVEVLLEYLVQPGDGQSAVVGQRVMQLLCNSIVANAETQAILWSHIFPNTLCLILRRAPPATAAYAPVLVHNLTAQPDSSGRSRLEALCDEPGKHLLATLYEALDKNEKSDVMLDWTSHLTRNLFLQATSFPELALSLLSTHGTPSRVMMKVLDGVLHHAWENREGDGKISLRDASLNALCKCMVLHLDNNQSNLDGNYMLLWIHTLGSLSAFLSDAQRLLLMENGFIAHYLPLLAWKKPSQFYGRIIDKVEVMRFVANVSFRCRAVQNHVRELGGLVMVLNLTHYDDTYPYQREWAIVCIRNLCEGNEANQKFIQELAPIKVVDSPELRDQGLQARLENGAVKVSRTGKQV
mmetsp:Transcript_22918/g.64398  ORF Transcript_22918/g.64398 Transcript_22918/m.64398 type:complete len:404 (+) Transcript_22918:28-1239(+)